MERKIMNGKAGWCSGFTLKMIAVISMFIDHSAAAVLERMMYYAPEGSYPWIEAHWSDCYRLYMWMRGIGRLAFPIYCFLLVEGFLHTRNVVKYALRLFLFSLLSELPFDLAFNHGWWAPGSNNVFFTLLVGLMVLAGIDGFGKWLGKFEKKGLHPYWKRGLHFVVGCVILYAGMILADGVLFTDYGGAGVLAITVIGLLRKFPVIGCGAAVFILGQMCGEIEYVAFFILPLICFYNGQRGRQIKYFFYAFYPVHLLFLVGVALVMGLPL